MFPGDAAIFGVVVGPGEKFDNPGAAHLAHHLQAALNFPRLNFISEAGMDTDDGVIGIDGLQWTRGDEQWSRSNECNDEDDTYGKKKGF